jgi:GcrA cell cycle regulator
MTKNFTWDATSEQRLRELFKDGHTALEIANRLSVEFGPVTRNAVIGKWSRLRLPDENGGARRNGGRPPKNPAPKPNPATEEPMQAQKTEPKRIGVQYIPRPDPIVTIELPTTGRVTLLDLREGHCRYPMGDPRDEGFRFCGEHAPIGVSYCAAHRQLCYVPPPPRRGKKRAA